MRKLLLIGAAAGLTTLYCIQAVAQDYVVTKGKLSDRNFYRVIACAAPPGGECQKKIIKLSPSKSRRLTIGITQVETGFPKKNLADIQAALSNAIQQINNTGAGVMLTQISQGTPDSGCFSFRILANSAVANRPPLGG